MSLVGVVATSLLPKEATGRGRGFFFIGSSFFFFVGIKESICNFGLCGSSIIVVAECVGVHLVKCACVIELPELKICPL